VLLRRVSVRAVLRGSFFAIVLALVYVATVRTIRGQRFEDVVLQAANGRHSPLVVDVLDSFTVWSVAAVIIIVVVIGKLRGLLFLGLVAAGVIVLSVVSTEVLQHGLTRPLLLSHGYRRQIQSFPSGHVAIAMSMMAALVLVVPYRLRGLVTALGALWAVGIGALTVTASWHRPGDTLGSDLIVVCYACLAVLVLARCGRIRTAPEPASWVPAAVLTGVAGVAIPITLALIVRVEQAIGREANWLDLRLDSALWAGRFIALSGGALTALALLFLLRGIELSPPVRAAEPARPTTRRPDHAH
jgi:membrane-associated phospholipid phosphatase